MQRSTLAKRAWPLLFFSAIIIFYFYGLGYLPLVGPDEPRYAQVAREMYLRADPVTPTLAGHTWFEKPSLLYWMMMVCFRAFGVSEWTARLPSAFAGLLTAFIIYWMGRRVERSSPENETRGLALWSSVALATSVGLIAFSRGVSFDILVTMTLTAALACFFCAEIERDDKRRRLLLAGFYVSVGASLLSKGLVGIIIPFGVPGLYYLLRREWPGKRTLLSLLWGMPLAVAVALIWYGPVTVKHGWTFIDEFFIQHHFVRYISNKYHHPQPFYFYIPVMLLLTLPWMPFLITALMRIRGWDWRGPSVLNRFEVFALSWLVVPVLFFSLSGSKLPGYVLPALPGAALLMGEQVARVLRGEARARAIRVMGVILFLLAGLAVVAGHRSGLFNLSCEIAIAAPLALTGIILIVWAQRRFLCLALVVGAMLLSMVIALNCAVAAFTRGYSVRDLMAQASARGYSSTPVFQLHTIDYTAEFYAAGRLAHQPDGKALKFEGVFEVMDAARRAGGPVLVIVPVEHLRQLSDYAPLQTEIIGDNGEVALVAAWIRE